MTTDTEAEHDRHLPFELAWNFRDLGGYATTDGRVTKWRTIFRADGVHRLTVDDLAPLGIRTVVDLRTPLELEERGRFSHDDVDYHHLPVLQATWERDSVDVSGPAERFLANRYLEMLESGRETIPLALRLLADPAAVPLVFHCAAGKDRTGVVAALTLSLLGVPDETIVHDYALSTNATEKLIAWRKVEYPDRIAEIESQPTAFMSSPAEAMHLFLADLRDRHGSVERYAESVGVAPDTIDALRANLLT
jgi:protein tyrosine/serine phosphatase